MARRLGYAVLRDVEGAAKPTDAEVGFVGPTAPRSVTLPAAADFSPGQPLYIADERGACGTDRPIIVAAASAETVAGQADVALASPYQKAVFHYDGTSLWIL